MAETSKIPGELESVATGGKVADVRNIKDGANGNKSQAEINAEHEAALEDRYTKEETYSKEELDSLITTPSVQYVSVVATAQTTAVTDVLPVTGAADTIYRVGFWDGTQYDATKYSEYAWNGTLYVLLSVKSAIGEVYDISAAHNGTTYADLAAALGTNGVNVPEGLRKGGMSVKFIQGSAQSSDNKYVQFRLMHPLDNESTKVADFTNVANWQGVDDVPTKDSNNLITSEAVSAHGNALDVSALNGGALYDTMSNAIAAVPVKYKRGGMTIKYKDSSEIYRIARLKYKQWTLNTSFWVSETDTPTLNSPDLMTSGGTHKGLIEIGKVYQDTVNLDVEEPDTWKHILSDIQFYRGNYYEVEISRTGENRNIIYGLGSGNIDNIIEIIRATETEFTLKFEIPNTANKNSYFLEARATTTTPLTGEIAITAVYKTPLESRIDKKIGDVATGINNNIAEVNQQIGNLSGEIDSVEHDLQELDNGGIITQNELIDVTHASKASGRIGNHYAVTSENINSTFYVRIYNPNKARVFISTLKRDPQYYTSGDILSTIFFTEETVIDREFTIPEADKENALFIGIYIPQTEGSFTVGMLSYKNSIDANAYKANTAKEDIRTIQTDIRNINTDITIVKDVVLPGTDIVKLNDITKTLYRIKSAKKTAIDGNETEVTPLMLLHFSDIHANATGLARVKEFAQYYTEYLDDVICTGDLVFSNLLPVETTMAFWNNAEVSSYLTCVGNHEGSFGNEGATAKQVYDGIIAPYVSSWGNVVQPANASEDGLSYYYKDYTASNVRLIVLDAYTHGDDNYRSEQAAWLSNVLAGALTNGLSVLCAIHQAGSNLTKFNCAFSQMSSDWNSSGIPTIFASAVDTFMTNGGDFVGWIAGHTHRDVCGIDSVYNKQLKIIIDCTKFSDSGELIRLENDKSYDLFNLVAVDTVNKTIKLIRIGADLDMYLRKRETMSIQYASNSYSTIATPTVISNNGD